MSAEYQTRKHQIVVKVLDWMYDLLQTGHASVVEVIEPPYLI